MPYSKTTAAGTRRAQYAFILLGGLVTAQTSNGQPPPPAGYKLYTLGLTGNGYESPTTGGTVRNTLLTSNGLNAAGQATGITLRTSTVGDSGYDAWLWTGSTTQLIGLTGPGYQYAVSGGGSYRYNTSSSLNAAGQVLGKNDRFNSAGTDLGQDGWLWNGSITQQIGLTGPGYEFTTLGTGGGTYRFNSPSGLNDAGQATGQSDRYNTSRKFLGQDTWIWSGSATQQIGLTGTGYEYTYTGTGGGTFRQITSTGLNAAGQVRGYSFRYNPSGTAIGQDAWLWNGSTTQQIGLTGPGYEYAYTGTGGGTFRTTTASALNAAGQAIGGSARYNASGKSLGNDAWFWNGSTTQQVGVTGAGYEYAYTGTGGGTFHANFPVALNAAGQMAGTSNRYNAAGNALGQDAWLWNGSTTQLIGLTGAAYEYPYAGTGGGTFRSNRASSLNAAAQAIGSSNRYNTSGNALGQDAWLWNGVTSQQVGLTGAGYEYTFTGTGGGTVRSSTASALNILGQSIGSANRYNATGGSLGQDAWFYDPLSATTIALQFSSRSTDGYRSSTAEVLTDNGVVLGKYELFNGTADLGSRAFWWSLASGFYDLGALANGGLTANGWQSLADAVAANAPAGFSSTTGGSPWYIVGPGQTVGQAAGASVFLLVAVPEPTAAATLPLAAGGLLSRRRRAIAR